MKIANLMSALAIAVGVCACGNERAKQTTDKTTTKSVYTVNYPLQFFAQKIAGDTVNVHFPAPGEDDPAFWEPSAEEIAKYQQAGLILLNGADYAKWVKTATLPDSIKVNTSDSFSNRYLKQHEAVTHSHGPEGDHDHGVLDFNTWVDQDLALRQAEAVFEALCRTFPEYKDIFKKNFTALAQDLKNLDNKLKTIGKELDNQPLIASHPVYNYAARAYNWNLKSLHWEPEQMPSDKEWKNLAELLKSHPAKIMIWEDEPDAAIAAKVKAMGIKVVVFRPCGNTPPNDYVTEMKANISRLKNALK